MLLGLVLTSLLSINFGDGLKQGEKEDKWIFVYFTSNDCSWCHKLKKDTFEDSSIKTELSRYVFVEVNISEDKEVYNLFKRLFSRTNFNSQGLIPAYYMINPYTKKFYRWGYGFKDSTKFVEWLKTNQN